MDPRIKSHQKKNLSGPGARVSLTKSASENAQFIHTLGKEQIAFTRISDFIDVGSKIYWPQMCRFSGNRSLSFRMIINDKFYVGLGRYYHFQ